MRKKSANGLSPFGERRILATLVTTVVD